MLGFNFPSLGNTVFVSLAQCFIGRGQSLLFRKILTCPQFRFKIIDRSLRKTSRGNSRKNIYLPRKLIGEFTNNITLNIYWWSLIGNRARRLHQLVLWLYVQRIVSRNHDRVGWKGSFRLLMCDPVHKRSAHNSWHLEWTRLRRSELMNVNSSESVPPLWESQVDSGRWRVLVLNSLTGIELWWYDKGVCLHALLLGIRIDRNRRKSRNCKIDPNVGGYSFGRDSSVIVEMVLNIKYLL